MKLIVAGMWFAAIQLISLVVTVVGWILLIPFCIAQAWVPTMAVSGRQIDRWKFRPLNWVYGNVEDGVSGQHALIWTATGQVPYRPNAHPAVRAYLWSAWRNSADNLKYLFRWSKGPFLQLHIKAGWNSSGLPVISVSRE